MVDSAQLRILFVDDELVVRRSVRQLLGGDHRFEVALAINVNDGRRRLDDPNGRYHVVLSDYDLGDGFGTELLATVRTRLPHARRWLTSAGAPVVPTGADANVQEVFPKLQLQSWLGPRLHEIYEAEFAARLH